MRTKKPVTDVSMNFIFIVPILAFTEWGCFSMLFSHTSAITRSDDYFGILILKRIQYDHGSIYSIGFRCIDGIRKLMN
ncbi:hypothetical protein [Hanstruepera ponticola]|uniref:hypothetical protein n=1 Tax=Hanstruepera ponticola TaxID=2042995 RepID=UPI00177C8763|nr:hypothetical protein [Hanstruepera ponticola]